MKLKPKHTCPDSQTILSNKWIVTMAINKVVALAINKVVMMLVVPAMMAKHVRGMQMTVTTWTKCLGAFGPEILEKSKRGLENLERVTKASKKTVYDAEKGCPTYFTLLRFVLELLILKAKYGWSDCSFDDLLCLMSRLLPRPNTVPANTYQAKKVISPLTLGVEKNPCMPQPLYPFLAWHIVRDFRYMP